MTISEMDLLTAEEKKAIIRKLSAVKLMEDYDAWQRTFNPLDFAHCETRDMIREEIVSRLKTSDSRE